MNYEYEKKLEAEIDREIKRLPELLAPHTLLLRVMKAIESRASLPWYRQSWQVWPVAARVLSLAVLLLLFAGLCFAGWKLAQAESLATLTHRLSGWFAGVGAVCNA